MDVLASLLRHVGAEDGDADSLSRKIVALRDADRTSSPTDVAARQASTGKPDQQSSAQSQPPFTDMRQLAGVSGMRPEWIIAMAPLVTVFGGEAVNPLTAPVEVIRALPFFEEARLESFLEMRRGPFADGDRIAFLLGRTQQYLKVQQRQVVSVDLLAGTTGGYSVNARGFIALLSGDRQPYRVLAWEQGAPLVLRDVTMLAGDANGH